MQAGFLGKDEKEPEPSGAAALEALLTTTLDQAETLRAQQDPEEEPYRSRYEERRLLTRLFKQAGANAAAEPDGSDPTARANVVRAISEGMLGMNFMDTEEGGQATSRLESALRVLSDVPGEDVRCIELLNRLGITKANQEEIDDALALLERARAAYERLAAGGEPPSQRVEELHTLTCFYLAQAHGSKGHVAQSASFCQRTMQRQLQRRDAAGAGEHAFNAHECLQRESNPQAPDPRTPSLLSRILTFRASLQVGAQRRVARDLLLQRGAVRGRRLEPSARPLASAPRTEQVGAQRRRAGPAAATRSKPCGRYASAEHALLAADAVLATDRHARRKLGAQLGEQREVDAQCARCERV